MDLAQLRARGQRRGRADSFTEAAAGRRVAQVQAGLWIISYLLYVLYTTSQIVYDILPVVLPGEQRYQTVLELVVPVVLAAVMIAGRAVTLLVIGLLAAGQLAIAAVLGGLTLANVATPVSSFGGSAPAGSLAIASGQTALLYICGSLPFFLGGDLSSGLASRQPSPGGTPERLPAGAASRRFPVISRGLIGAYIITVVVIIACVAPLAGDPSFTQASIPGMAVAQRFAGHGLAVTVGIGVAASTAGVILVEYLALSLLLTAVTRWPLRRILIGIGVVMVAFSPVILINPDQIYDDLIAPSLVALWLSQLIVFAVYPRFAAKHGRRAVPAWVLALASSAFVLYGLWTAIQNAQV